MIEQPWRERPPPGMKALVCEPSQIGSLTPRLTTRAPQCEAPRIGHVAPRPAPSASVSTHSTPGCVHGGHHVRDRAIHQKLDRLDEAFLYSESIDLTSYSRTLEGAFVDELAFLQPTPGYMRLVKDRILHVWEQRRAEANERSTEQERGVKAVVLPGRNRVRRKSIQSNRRNGATFQVLGAA